MEANISDRLELYHEAYTVGWICALSIELAAATAMLDSIHQRLPCKPGDTNVYNFGNISQHNIVIACLPSGHYGTINAAVVANNMHRSFPSIRTRLMVGIGGGVPLTADIRLGDVVVGHEVLQYDFGKTTKSGVFHRTSNPVRPPQGLLTVITNLRASHESAATNIYKHISDMITRNPQMAHYDHPVSSQDLLFESTYEHNEMMDNCDSCDHSRRKTRPLRSTSDPQIHYGTIASGNQVMKHGPTRDSWSRQDNILCFEMEAAGLINHFPCLVIRGICDYCDSHKAKEWQAYSAAVAAAFAKEVLMNLGADVSRGRSIQPERHPPPVQHWAGSEKYESLMNSLAFERIDSRRRNIQRAHLQTCEWFFDNEAFQNWKDPEKLRQHGGFLWIKGKPGAGKSTLMKYLLEHSQTCKENDAILGFFFHARGEGLEKSTLGLFRSLLLQLLTKIPRLKKVFDSLGENVGNNICNPPGPLQIEWSLEMLKELFEQAIDRLNGSSVTCYIDALDECNECEIRDMVSFFERVGQIAMSTGAQIYICFSSRHYPHISLREGLGIESILEKEDDHDADIMKYVNSNLNIGESELAKAIRLEILDKASGVFLWVVLVVRILSTERARGQLHALRRRLHDIPPDLHKLFESILSKQRNRMATLFSLQMILCASKPLTLWDLYVAVRSKLEPNPPNPTKILLHDISLFILDCTMGLAEIINSKPPFVQFIHESVRDFILLENGLGGVWSDMDLEANFEGNSHLTIRDLCLEYCYKAFIALNRECEPWSDKTPPLAVVLARLRGFHEFPFLSYALPNVFFHADAASERGISQREFLSKFPFKGWVWLHNIVSLKQHSPNTQLLYLLADANLSHLVRYWPFGKYF